MVELLKQPQYQPLPVEEQVAVIFAAGRGFMDDVDVSAVRKFEEQFLDYLRNKGTVLKDIREKKALDDALTASLGAAIDDFKKGFRAEG
jgi:F-type H+-transporting ATPase subunit alpha